MQWGLLSNISAWKSYTFTFPINFTSFNIALISREHGNDKTEFGLTIINKTLNEITVYGYVTNKLNIITIGK